MLIFIINDIDIFEFQDFFMKTEKYNFKTLIYFFKNTFGKVFTLLSPVFIQLFLANCKFIQLIQCVIIYGISIIIFKIIYIKFNEIQ